MDSSLTKTSMVNSQKCECISKNWLNNLPDLPSSKCMEVRVTFFHFFSQSQLAVFFSSFFLSVKQTPFAVTAEQKTNASSLDIST